MDTSSHERGRKKLMLRLPALRDDLRTLVGDSVFELLESYDLATSALERFRNTPASDKLIAEYEDTCREIEREVVQHCRENGL